MAIINDRIKHYRLSLGLTLREVADVLGVKEATMQRYESGAIKSIPYDTVVALADIFKVHPAHLMGWDGKGESSQIKQEVLAFIDTLDAEQLQTLLDVARSIYRERDK